MFIAPAAPESIGGTLNVNNVGHETNDEVLMVHFMNFVLTLVIRISSNAATDIFVTTIALFDPLIDTIMGVKCNGPVFENTGPA